MVRADIPFVTSTWLRDYRNAYFTKGIPNTLYYHYHHKVLDQILPGAMNGGSALTACYSADENTIAGYLVYEVVDTALVLHYCFVKAPLRRVGIARKLIETAIDAERPAAVMMTHKTWTVSKVMEREEDVKRWIYNPYLLFQKLPDRWAQ